MPKTSPMTTITSLFRCLRVRLLASRSFCSFLSPYLLYNFHSNPIIPSSSAICSIIHSHSYTHASASNPNTEPKNLVVFNYLVDSLAFPKPLALSISDRFSHIKTIEKPQSVVHCLKNFGFSDIHIRSSIRCVPQILFCNIEKTLKPKLLFLQELGLSDSHLGEVISKNSAFLTYSLDKRLKPSIQILKKILVNDEGNEDLIRVLRRCCWVAVTAEDSESRVMSNVAYLKSCGIVGLKLSKLLVRQPRLFGMRESALRELVSRILDMGFVIDSPMFVYALFTLKCLSRETFSRKFELVRGFGFSDAECLQMFRNLPLAFGASEKKLKVGIEFFLNTVKLKRSILVSHPACLKYSLKERVIPRYKVLQTIKLKRLLNKEPSFACVLALPEEKFLQRYISRFIEDAEELLAVYKGDILASPEQ